MTGSSLAPVIIPIVVMIGLAIWLIMVFRADSHPGYRYHVPAAPRQVPGQAMRAAARRQVPRTPARPLDKAAAGGRVPDLGGHPGTGAGRPDPLAPSHPGAGRRAPAGQASRQPHQRPRAASRLLR
jgi:hypothetical protein